MRVAFPPNTVEALPEKLMSRGTLLLIDPHDDQRELYSDALHAAGFSVVECPQAHHALHLAASVGPVAIITEVGSERQESGWELIARLRENERTAQVPIIALGSRWILEEGKAALARGVTAYLPIPLSPPDLVEAVRRVTADRTTP